jgi:membrane fusion protein (multidrug efflux system)
MHMFNTTNRFWLMSSLLVALVFSCGEKAVQDPKVRLAEIQDQMAALQSEADALRLQMQETESGLGLRVNVMEVKPERFNHFIEVPGVVEGEQVMLATPQQPGVVKEILVREGDRVNAGQVLAKLESDPILAAMQEVETGLTLARTTYDRTARLWEQQIGSELQYLQAKANVEGLENRLASMKAQLAMTFIKAPVTGQVDWVGLKLGEMASPGFSGIRVANYSKVKIMARLADRYAGKIKVGTPVEVLVTGENTKMEAEVRFVSGVIDAASRSFMVEIRLKNNAEELTPNRLMSLKINDIAMDSVLTVPSNVLQSWPDGQYVMIAAQENGAVVARRRKVETGPSYAGKQVILQGISAGDLVLMNGIADLTDGATLQIN